MKMVTMYRAVDGALFEEKADALEHEGMLAYANQLEEDEAYYNSCLEGVGTVQDLKAFLLRNSNMCLGLTGWFQPPVQMPYHGHPVQPPMPPMPPMPPEK